MDSKEAETDKPQFSRRKAGAGAGALSQINYDYAVESIKNPGPDFSSSSSKVWNCLEKTKFSTQFLSSVKEWSFGDGDLKDQVKELQAQEVPPIILKTLIHPEESSFHPMTFLNLINTLPNHVQKWIDDISTTKLREILCKFWLNEPYLVSILIDFSMNPDSSRKEVNIKNFYNEIFKTIEFLDQSGAGTSDNEIFELLISKIDAVLRAFLDYFDTDTVLYTGAISTLLSRTILRFWNSGASGAGISDLALLDPPPFVKLIKSLSSITSHDYKGQRLISKILYQLPIGAQEKVLILWFQVAGADETGNPKSQLFYPISKCLSEGSSLRKVLLDKIPFKSTSVDPKFWINWAQFITSDSNLFVSVWDEFIKNYFHFVNESRSKTSDSDIIYNPTLAFIALGRSLKEKSKNQKLSLQFNEVMNQMTILMDATDSMRHDISLVVAKIIFDLERSQKEDGGSEGEGPTLDFGSNCSKMYTELMGFYETGEIIDNLDLEVLHSAGTSGTGNDLEEASASAAQTRALYETEEQLARLRHVGLIPTSFQNIYDIFVGQTKGKDEIETELLHQISILRIPLLLKGGVVPDNTVGKRIIRSLLDCGDDQNNEDGDDQKSQSEHFRLRLAPFVSLALRELGSIAPESLSSIFRDLLFNERNHSIGDKIRIIQHVQGLLEAQLSKNKQNQINWDLIQKLEPKYLQLEFPQLKQITPAAAPEPESSTSKSLEIVKPEPKTRRWGTKRSAEVDYEVELESNQRAVLALALWDQTCRGLITKFDEPANGPNNLLLITIFHFLESTMIHSVGRNMERQAIELVQLYGSHSEPNVRCASWKILHDLLVLKSIHVGIPFTHYISDNPSIYNQLFEVYFANEKDADVYNYIKTVKRMFDYFKSKLNFEFET